MATEQPLTGGAWPTTRWELSAPESYVLLNGAGASGREAFKVALVELVARGTLVLRTVEGSKSMFGRGKPVSTLIEGGKGAPSERPLRVLWELFHAAPKETFSDGTRGVRVEKLAEAARKRYTAIGRYVPVDVLPSLVDRDFFRKEQQKVLFVFTKERHVLSEKGERAKAELEQLMGIGREQLGGLVDRNPPQALAYLGLAGAGVLLMSDMFPDLQRLRSQLGSSGYTGDGGTYISAGSDDDGDGFSFEGFGEGLDFDLGSFDSLDSAFDSIDSAVDSGGGSDSGSDGGGDSGGGDGGGGGGD